MPPVSAFPFTTPLAHLTPPVPVASPAGAPVPLRLATPGMAAPAAAPAPVDEGTWFPTAPLLAAAASGERLSDALVALDGQGRLLDELLAACAVGAASLPPALLAAVRTARAAVAAVHDVGAVPLG